MNLYVATVHAKLRRTRKQAPAATPETELVFELPLAALSPEEANILLQNTFPWTFFKHVEVQWRLLKEQI